MENRPNILTVNLEEQISASFLFFYFIFIIFSKSFFFIRLPPHSSTILFATIHLFLHIYRFALSILAAVMFSYFGVRLPAIIPFLVESSSKFFTHRKFGDMFLVIFEIPHQLFYLRIHSEILLFLLPTVVRL